MATGVGEEGLAAQAPMEKLPAGDAERAVDCGVVETSPDVGEAISKFLSLAPAGSSVRGARALGGGRL